MEKKLKKIGFIGCGHMASAIISGYKGEDTIFGAEINEEFAKFASERLKIDVITDNAVLAECADIIFVATKPNCVEKVLEGIKEKLTKEKLLVSIAAGVSTEKIEKIVGDVSTVRVMPNTPALVQTGMCAVCGGKFATRGQVEFVKNFLSSIGKCIEVEEKEMDIVTAISGSGPAFYYQVINALAKAGERLGMDYEKALLLSAQTALGSAKMLMASPQTPDELIRSVATPGGCTQVGADYFVNAKMDDLFYELIQKTAQKAHELG